MPEFPFFYASYVALWIVVLFQMLVLLELVRRVSQGRDRVGGEQPVSRAGMLSSGTVAPTFNAEDLSAERTISSDAWLGRHTLLLFVVPNCSACETTAGDVEGLRERVDARLVVVCHGDAFQCREFSTSYYPHATAVLDESGTIGGLFKVKDAPMAVLLDEEWRVLRYGFQQPSTARDLIPTSALPASNGFNG